MRGGFLDRYVASGLALVEISVAGYGVAICRRCPAMLVWAAMTRDGVENLECDD